MTWEILDLRSIADEWNDELVDLAEGRGPDGQEGPSYGEMAERVGKYEALCGELGCDPSPDDLRGWANDNEPSLIHESYFTKYAEELARDIGVIPNDDQWPLNRIDWDEAADDLKEDYTFIEYDGDTYYVRSY